MDRDTSKAPSKPQVLREFEFYGGCIRVKISVKNTSGLVIADAALELESDENVLHFDRCEPEYSEKKGKLILGSIYPDTDKTVAFYLDPLICAKEGTDINCRIFFKDAFGRSDMVQMEPLKIKVVCPIFRTEQDVNIGRLKELVSGLQFHDSKVYTIPRKVEISELLGTCRNVIQLHDVRHIKTFKTTDEKTYEAWYYGKTKVTKKDLVIKCCIRRDTESIEVFASGNDPGDITGLLAEIGRNLTREFERLGKVQPVFNIHIKDSIIQRSNLLSFCDIDGSCGGNVVIEDSVVQRSDIASWNEGAQKEREEEKLRIEQEEQERQRREEAQRREKEERERAHRQKEQEERAQKERIAREDASKRERERQKARQEEERLRRQQEEQERAAREREELAAVKEPEGTSWKGFFTVALVLGALLLGYWALAPGSNDASENLKSTPSPTPKITAATIQTPKVTLGGGASALSNDGGGSWAYYKDITISNSGGALSNYQVLVNLMSSNFPTNAHTSGADVRFTDGNGAELSYWIESWDYAGRSAKIWVNVTSISASGSTTIRMYYGNPSAGGSSNGRNTFEFFDDFEDGDYTNIYSWSGDTPYFTVQNSVVKNGIYSIRGGSFNTQTAEKSLTVNYQDTGGNIILESYLRMGSGLQWQWGIKYLNSSDGVVVGIEKLEAGTGGGWFAWWDSTNGPGQNLIPVAANNPYPFAYDTWQKLKIVLSRQTGKANYTLYNADDTTVAWSSNGLTISTSNIAKIKIFGYRNSNAWGGDRYFYVDNIRIRKFASPEPSVSMGAEQNAGTSTPSQSADKIAFVSDKSGTDNLWKINIDGSGLTQLTSDSVGVNSPLDISFDGTKIAWQKTNGPGGSEKIWKMNADGSGASQLTTSAGNLPRWSPDGTKIMFRSQRTNYNGWFHVYIMNSDGSNQQSVGSEGTECSQDWSPDSTKIVYAMAGYAGWPSDIYVMNVNGTQKVRIASGMSFCRDISWSPDGSKIAYVSGENGNKDIYIINPDGTGKTQLTTSSAGDSLEGFQHQIWSKDNQELLFQSNRNGNWDIYSINRDGSGETQLTNNSANDYYPTWSPDGTKIAFISERSGTKSIWVMNSDGGNQVQVTDNAAGNVKYLDWSPSPSVNDIEAKITNIWGSNYPIQMFGQNATLGQVVSADLDSSPISEPLPVYTVCIGPRNSDKSVISRFKISDTKVRIVVNITGGKGFNPGSEGYIKIVNPDWRITEILPGSTLDMNRDYYGTGITIDKVNGLISWSGRGGSTAAACNENEVNMQFIVEKVSAISPPDTTPPSIAISSPSNGQSVTTGTITVSGTASDNVGLSKVEVKVGAGSWQPASGTTSWSAQVTLSSGSNTIYARANDTSGNSAQTSVTVTYNPSVLTTITVSPSSASVTSGSTQTFTASGYDQNGNSIAISPSVYWSSSNITVGTIDTSESIGEKAYYLLTALIKEDDGRTQVMLRAVSDKPHGLNGFLNETVADLRHVVSTVQSALEIGVIKKEQVIKFINSVVIRPTIEGEGTTSVEFNGSVVTRPVIKGDVEKKRREEERLREQEEQEKQRREEVQRREKEERACAQTERTGREGAEGEEGAGGCRQKGKREGKS